MTTACLAPDALQFVCTLVRQRSAIELDDAKAYLIEARLGPVAKKNGFTSAAEMVTNLRAKPNQTIQQQLVEAMTTNETSFFRDIHPFEALRQQILPALQKLSLNRKLNIWSAACSTGQEAYSVAMLLRENFPDLCAGKVQILGTDIADEVLARARAGAFSQIEMNRGLPANLLARYFQRKGLQWEITSNLRELVSFNKLNFIEHWPPLPTMDVVFLRNVLIYFSPATKRQILEKVRAVMAPHAVLFLGAAETTMNLDSSFVRVQVDNQVFYKLK
ncbi:CheR family methyltransferase [Anatilimnocola floriformis]|uniref:CheR family methyltransferase n=1 Tax=Anatilimnocola floriformis TaxID=2948575 RepID=UPI0020C5841A|nr:protein-glutamate O-methyltransferase CheR [Anatilimnocola floriformis]